MPMVVKHKAGEEMTEKEKRVAARRKKQAVRMRNMADEMMDEGDFKSAEATYEIAKDLDSIFAILIAEAQAKHRLKEAESAAASGDADAQAQLEIHRKAAQDAEDARMAADAKKAEEKAMAEANANSAAEQGAVDEARLAAEKEAAEEAARRKKMAEDDAARLEIERLAALKADAEAKAVNDAADAEKKLAADAAAAAQSKAEAELAAKLKADADAAARAKAEDEAAEEAKLEAARAAAEEEGRRIAQEKRLQLEAETKRAMAVQELKDDGDALFAQGNYDDAAVKYGQALSIDPADEDIREILIQSKVNAEAKCNCANLKKNGAAMLAVKEFDGAIVAYTAAVEADGDDAEAKAGLAAATRKKQALELKAQAEALSAKGDHAGSTELLLQAMNLDPDNKDISAEEETEARESKILELKALADKQFATGDYNGAAGNYGLAISLATPGESHPASSAAKLKTLTTTIVVAVPEGCAPGEVIEVEYPDGKTEDWTIPAGAKEGEVFTLAQKVEKTVVPGQEEPAAASSEYCTAATLKEMQDGLAKCNMKTEAREIESQGIAEFNIGKYADAEATLAAANKLDPTDQKIKSEYEAAKSKAAIQLLRKEGDALKASGKVAEASAKYQQALALDPDNEELKAADIIATKRAKAAELKEEANQMVADGDYSDAAATYSVAASLDPDDDDLPALIEYNERKARAKSYKLQGDVQTEHDDLDAAMTSYRRALEEDPEDQLGARAAQGVLLTKISAREDARALVELPVEDHHVIKDEVSTAVHLGHMNHLRYVHEPEPEAAGGGTTSRIVQSSEKVHKPSKAQTAKVVHPHKRGEMMGPLIKHWKNTHSHHKQMFVLNTLGLNYYKESDSTAHHRGHINLKSAIQLNDEQVLQEYYKESLDNFHSSIKGKFGGSPSPVWQQQHDRLYKEAFMDEKKLYMAVKTDKSNNLGVDIYQLLVLEAPSVQVANAWREAMSQHKTDLGNTGIQD